MHAANYYICFATLYIRKICILYYLRTNMIKKKIKITTKNIFTLVITYHLFPSYSIQSLYSPLNFNLLIHTTKLGTQN